MIVRDIRQLNRYRRSLIRSRKLSIEDARLDRNDYKRGTNWSRVLSSRTLFVSFRERQRQNDVAGVRTRAATSLVAMLSATSGQPLSTDRDNVVGPMILRLTPHSAVPSYPSLSPLSAPYSSFSPCEMIPLWLRCRFLSAKHDAPNRRWLAINPRFALHP